MPSNLHEAVLDLFRENPRWAAELVREAFGLPLAPLSIRPGDSVLPKQVPASLYPDLVLIVDEGDRRVALVIEIQLRVDRRKPAAWLCYLALLHQSLDCDVVVVVVTLSEAVAGWAAQPHRYGQPGHSFAPLVLGPSRIPATVAGGPPELRILSLLAHLRSMDAETCAETLRACAALDEARAGVYLDLILERLEPDSRALLERLMIQNYEYKSDFFKRLIQQGHEEGRVEGRIEGRIEGRLQGQQEGQLEGQCRGMAEAILSVLRARGLELTDAQRDRVLACADLDILHRWLAGAAVAASAAEALR